MFICFSLPASFWNSNHPSPHAVEGCFRNDLGVYANLVKRLQDSVMNGLLKRDNVVLLKLANVSAQQREGIKVYDRVVDRDDKCRRENQERYCREGTQTAQKQRRHDAQQTCQSGQWIGR
jgi:hypothetical protein